MRNVRYRFGCFSVMEDGYVVKVVAMGGSDGRRTLSSAEMLDVESMQWENLPSLPFQVYHNKGAESVIGPYLGFSVGGYGERRILGLRKQGDHNYQWEQVNGLSSCRDYHTVVNAPMAMVPSC